ncbi:nickel pincer cofactor biosynthesis protein LarB [Candidatus Formimonas warabiya]|uniref:1-(5-phosphoribosyl)-5-amino-4-imidazole-carboxylate carboxylase n=1 Tax=Formimonas warabiya TaxID=1761012 RepID=A0A3G1KV49_FORW1|nr:nickel pincer cofactor biosynthesis protein LarB [Candidatus Formimonas warabiya]ATW26393.1 1-(5-phosphoribosyl)-5-amino-4-imidazole-carboxylate carboxylase [Candidatus Formimonas warabiya]
MDIERLRFLLENVKSGHTTIDDALKDLKNLPYEDLGFARIDHHRALRNGYPEVVFCQGKTEEQVRIIMEKLVAHNRTVLATRATPRMYQEVSKSIPGARYHELGRIIEFGAGVTPKKGTILVISAGTADLPVAEEAAITGNAWGHFVEKLYDVGVAGIHRLLDKQQLLNTARVIIVVAGMEGALASVVAGLVDKPVIGVPTSVGYGASFLGLAPLLTMLNSCAAGIGVVNIDNGFGAAALASAIIRSEETES